MNRNIFKERAITSHRELLEERKRLETIIVINKALLVREFESAKADVTEKLKPAFQWIDVAKNTLLVLKSPPILAVASLLLVARLVKNFRHDHTSFKSATTLPLLVNVLLAGLASKRSSDIK